ncbi:hypothetical protein [Veillonella sp. VA139]|uniref:hypothetical protein n=1 Tax=Veillonella sp. VA139 TaxID=741830 RepID=UPI000F8C6F76|nr:hypothetical protein [Veillonella sp. VA139]
MKVRKVCIWFLIFVAIIGPLYLYINIHRYMDTKTFFRYEITYFYELRDYFNNLTIENKMYTYIVKGDYLYTYGVSGYTKTKLGLGIHIIKVVNLEYEKKYIFQVEGRGSFYSSIEELRYGYLDDITLLTNFEDMDDEDINTFYLLYKENPDIEKDLSLIEKSRFSYKDGKKVAQGLRELNNSLVKEYRKRNGEIKETN